MTKEEKEAAEKAAAEKAAADEAAAKAKADAEKLVPAKTVEAVAEEFRKALQTVQPQPQPKPDDRQTRLRELQGRRVEVLEKYEELSKAGEHGQALQLYEAYLQDVQEASQAPPVDPTKDKGFKAMFERAKRDAKTDPDNKVVFDHWSDEVMAEVDSMDPADRINPAMWDEAVRRVKLTHSEEYISMQVAERVKTATEPQGGGRRSATAPANDDTSLSEEYRDAADLLGYSYEQYEQLIKDADAAKIRVKMTRRPLVQVVPDKVEMGRGI